jgi:DNA-binding transcriptional regulator YiaG
MTSEELNKMLSDSGISQRSAAKFLEINERTMRRWCAGSVKAPKMAEYALRWAIEEMRKRGLEA